MIKIIIVIWFLIALVTLITAGDFDFEVPDKFKYFQIKHVVLILITLPVLIFLMIVGAAGLSLRYIGNIHLFRNRGDR